MLPTDVIENDAVYEVNKALNSTGYLSPNIPTKNTEPSWDGEVILYSDAFDHKKENIVGKIRIQVKGTMDEEFPNGKIRFPVSVVDLNNYYKTGGVIYFVVHVNQDHSTKIYYETFTKVKLTSILSNCKEQKTKTIEFLPLPNDPLTVARIFFQFNIDSEKQYSYTEDNMLTFENNNDNISKISFTISCLGCNGNIGKALFSNEEVYLYGSTNENENIQIPFKMIPKDIIIGKTVNYRIYANGKLFYESYSIQESKHERIICIGNSLKLHINSLVESVNVKINLINTLNERIQDLDFLINVAYGKGFTINNSMFDMDIKDKLDLLKLRKQLKFLKNIKKLFGILHISNNIDITKLTKDDVNKLGELVTAFIDKKSLTFIHDIPEIIKYVIADMQILIFAKKYDKVENSYKLKDLFNSNLDFAYSTPKGFEQVTVYSVLKADDYNTFSNIDYCNIVDKYKKFYTKNKNLPQYANYNVLELLSAYDKSNNTTQLEVADKLTDWIIEVDPEGYSVYLLNKFQITKRKRKLNDEENEKLYELIETPNSAEEIKLGAYILLDNSIMAKRYFEKLSESQKEEFIKYPIYKRFGEKLLK